MAWAPGKGVKGKDLKDYWEGDLGVSYIPWHKLKPDIDIEMLEDGGMIDEDTMPPWMKAKLSNTASKPALPSSSDSVDTSQPPPVPGTGLLQPPPMALPLVSPFQFGNRLLGIPPGMLPNVPIGVPPPNIMGLGSPFQSQLISQMGAEQAQGQAGGGEGLGESLMNMTQPFGMMPQPPIGLPAPHDDNMDIEMEDAEKPERPMLLSEQLQASMAQFSRQDMDMDDRRDRERRRSREMDRDRNR